MSRARLAPAVILAALAVAIPAVACASPPSHPPDDDPTRQSPFGGQLPPPLESPRSPDQPPPGFRITAREAIAAASASEAISDQLSETPDADPMAWIRGTRWQIGYFAPDGEEVARAIVDGRTGAVDEAWRSHQVDTELARGYSGAVAQQANAAYVWIPLCVLFLVPFLDPRRPFRLLHLDLLVLVGLSASLYFFNRAEITISVPLYYPVLGYVLVRMLAAGLWPRERDGPVVPLLPIRVLAIATVVLVAGRIALNIVDSRVIDIGVAGVIGGDRITAGEPLYEGGFSPGLDLRGDVYGPANYLAYVPFEAVLPWDGTWNAVPAAHAAAIAFDLLCVVGLLALGRRLRAGTEGRALGWALAFAWVAYPFTLYTLNANANDALVAALGVGALLALRSPPARGAFVALGAAAKFGSAALAPLFATGTGERRWRSAAAFTFGFLFVAVLVVAPLLPDGGVREFYDRTLGYQAARGSPFSVWGLAPTLEPLQPVARVAAAALALGVALWPRVKSPLQIAALAAAVTVAIQLTAAHWFYFSALWFLPFLLVAAFGAHRRIAADPEAGPDRAPAPRLGHRERAGV